MFYHAILTMTQWIKHEITVTSWWARWVSNHQPHDCLLNWLFRRRSKKTSKLWVTGLCARNSPVTGEFPVQMASNAENVSSWWRHHESSIRVSKEAGYYTPLGILKGIAETLRHGYNAWLRAVHLAKPVANMKRHFVMSMFAVWYMW